MIREQESPESNEKQRRRRIVIDFQQPATAKALPRTRNRRWPKVLLAMGVVIVAVAGLAAGGAYFWWQHYQTTPAYSLALLVDAAQRNDIALVDQLVDTDKIVNGLASQVTEKTSARYGASLNPATRNRVEALVPGLLPSVKRDAREALTKRVREISESSDQKPFIALAISLPYLVSITAEADSARVVAPVGDKQLELNMQRDGQRWRVTAMKDDALVQRIVDKIITEFPAIGKIR